MTQFYNRKAETSKRRVLRNAAPEAERRLWERLKGKQINGCKFRRQYGVGPYVVDFYCPTWKLAIEIDGDSHQQGDTPEYDQMRQTYIEQFGIRFLRFTNRDVFVNISGVLEVIEQAVTNQWDFPGRSV